MAQKRNPVSLRLQTRLRGNEKRFASCWFTDFFFSQTYTNDLVKRLYLGYLLQKGGSWYSEKSESRVPETCLSIQFLYRRSSILSIILDRRKEEYIFSNSLRNPKAITKSKAFGREAIYISSQREDTKIAGVDNVIRRIGDTFLNPNVPNPFLSTGINVSIGKKSSNSRQEDALSKDVLNIKPAFTSIKSCGTRVGDTKETILARDIPYLAIANSFGISRHKSIDQRLNLSKESYGARIDMDDTLKDVLSNKHVLDKRNFDQLKHLPKKETQAVFPLDINQHHKQEMWSGADGNQVNSLSDTPTLQNKLVVYKEEKWRDWVDMVSCRYRVVPNSAYLSTIESFCEISEREKSRRDSDAATSKLSYKHFIKILERDYTEQIQLPYSAQECIRQRASIPSPSKLPCHWSSWNLIRGVSSYQSIEFCLYLVIFLYKRRLSFLQIKETLFKMLAASGVVRGARLVCSGRQGGRSKSAMRAKKQSALWGQTALSLFSSQLAFASTGVDTSFGQIGIKLWICYESKQSTVRLEC